MKTTLDRSTTKDKLLDAAYEAMLAKGYVATSVDEICEKAGVTKGSFFYYFDSKETLAKALLERACSSNEEMDAKIGKETDPLKRVYTLVDFMIEKAKKEDFSKGCLLGTFAQELSDTHPEIRKICEAGFNQFADKLSGDLSAAKKLHAPRATFTPRSIAEHLIAILEGSLILSKVHQDRRRVINNLEHFKHYLKALFGG